MVSGGVNPNDDEASRKFALPVHIEEGGAAVINLTAARLRKDPDFVDSAAG